MEVDIITLITLVVMIGIFVVAHEWGHFIVARIFGIRVDEFSIGFGPRMARVAKLGDTEYNIRWIPLGGYVKIAGMEADEEPLINAKEKVMKLVGSDGDPNKAEIPLIAENTPDKSEDEVQRRQDDVDGFYSKPIWQRSLVIFAGPFMSFALGILIYCNMGWVTGIPTAVNKVGSVNKGSEAQRMGLKVGDWIVNIDGKPIGSVDAMIETIYSNCGKALTVTVNRHGQDVVLHGTPQPLFDDQKKPFMFEGKQAGYFGFAPGTVTKLSSFPQSWKDGFSMTRNWFVQMREVFSHPATIGKNTGSIVEIAAMTHSAVQHGASWVLLIAGQVTLSLAVFNLLPIPVLDGGHLMIFLIEWLRRGRRLSPEQQQNFMLAGLVCIGILFIAVMSNSILKAYHHQLPQIP